MNENKPMRRALLPSKCASRSVNFLGGAITFFTLQLFSKVCERSRWINSKNLNQGGLISLRTGRITGVPLAVRPAVAPLRRIETRAY
jgi:hypothetical protein